MTELLQEIIDLKYPIKPLLINGGWLEIDTNDDHKKYSELYFKNQLNDFIKIDEI
jgi:NDP-sugar pyrophosphorylase family protein